MAVVVAADAVVKRFGAVTALAGATLRSATASPGLVGANGAGKTTLLGLVLGLSRPDEGTIAVLGLDPMRAGPEVRALVGYSPEHHNLPGDMRAVDLVAHLAEIHGLPRRDAIARASDALWQVGLGEERFRALGTMSTGQRQRVKLAAALAHDPHLLLLDEPTDGLDPVQRDDMLTLIRRIGTEYGIDVLLSSHLLDEVERVCDAAVILGDGRVLASGPLDRAAGQRRRLGGRGRAGRTTQLAAGLAGGRCPGATTVGVAAPRRGRRVGRRRSATRSPTSASALVRLERRRLSLEDVFLEAGVYGDVTGTATSLVR